MSAQIEDLRDLTEVGAAAAAKPVSPFVRARPALRNSPRDYAARSQGSSSRSLFRAMRDEVGYDAARR